MNITTKPQIKFFNGIPIYIPNETFQISDDWYISYNKSSRDYGIDTTAIVIGQMQIFCILKGNHFNILKELAETKGFCHVLSYFMNHKELVHEMSDVEGLFNSDNFVNKE